MNNQYRILRTLACLLAMQRILSVANDQQALQDHAEQILTSANIKGGFVVHIGCDDGHLTDALDGQYGAVQWAGSTSNGEKRLRFNLDSQPVFDGMIAANGRLFIATKDGGLTCRRKRLDLKEISA